MLCDGGYEEGRGRGVARTLMIVVEEERALVEQASQRAGLRGKAGHALSPIPDPAHAQFGHLSCNTWLSLYCEPVRTEPNRTFPLPLSLCEHCAHTHTTI